MKDRTPAFIYFDLGNVLLSFDHQLAAQQMADVAGVSSDKVWQVVFGSDLEESYESGKVATEEFFEVFCRETGTNPNRSDLLHAASDIFQLNVPLVPVVAQLKSAGFRLGILSNTNEAHWHFVSRGRYRIVRDYFETRVLSYEVGSMKPELEIYSAAAKAAGVEPEKIFFTDDREENVAGAIEAGFDAVRFQETRQLVRELLDRGIDFNY